MCVAAIVFNKVSLEYLRAMDKANPHGAGVAWQRGNTIAFKRGLTPDAIHAMQESGELTCPYLMHFRWATHGSISPELTHPFPLGPRAFMGELEGEADRVLIHNGTWADYDEQPVPNELRSLADEMSDTAIAAFMAATNPEILSEVPWATAVGFLDEDGALDVTLRGNWSENGGNWYSNLSWLPWESRHGSLMQWRANSEYDFDSVDWGWEGYKPYRVPTDTAATTLETARGGSLSWEDYVRAKYGDAVAEELNRQMADEPIEELTLCELQDANAVSEDFDTVNSFIEKSLKEGCA